jgi:hypothetical protein
MTVFYALHAGSGVFQAPLVNDIKTTKPPHVVTPFTPKDLQRAIFASTNTLCGKSVEASYVKGHYSSNPMVFVLCKDKDTLRSPVGFVLAREQNARKDKGVFLEVICAPGWGGALLEFFHQFVFNNGYDFVQLNAVANFIPFYNKHKYEVRKTCKGPALTGIPASLSNKATLDDVYSDEEYLSFIYNTLYRRFNMGAATTKKRCKSKPLLSKKQYISSALGCPRDGYTMMRCRG